MTLLHTLPLLIFVHGGPGFDDYLAKSFAKITKENNLPSVFYTQKKDVPLEELVIQLQREIERAPTENVVLVGHSWGGALAVETLKRTLSKKVVGLVLMDSPVSFDFDDAFKAELKRLGLDKNYTSADIFLSAKQRKNPESERYLSEVMETLDQKSLDRIYDSYLGTLQLRPLLKSLQIPTLFIFGENDVRVPAHYQKEIASSMSNAKTVQIQGSGHFPFLLDDEKNQVITAIKEFVTAIDLKD